MCNGAVEFRDIIFMFAPFQMRDSMALVFPKIEIVFS